METAIMVVTVVAGVYEVASRIVPTSKTWSMVGLVINALKAISDGMDRKKTVKK